MHQVTYKYRTNYRYYPNHDGVFPVVEMFIEANAKEIDLLAIVDTGARNTLISPEYARAIGLDVDKGIRKEFTPAKGFPFWAYGHQVQVRILDEIFQAELFFCEEPLFRCLLGRDILEKMQIGLNESHSTFFLF